MPGRKKPSKRTNLSLDAVPANESTHDTDSAHSTH